MDYRTRLYLTEELQLQQTFGKRQWHNLEQNTNSALHATDGTTWPNTWTISTMVYQLRTEWLGKWLPIAQLAESSKVSLDYANHENYTEKWEKELEFVRERMATYYNKRRWKGPISIVWEGDMVYALRRNIKTTWPSDKLELKKLGPIQSWNNDFKNQLRTFATEKWIMRIHPIFSYRRTFLDTCMWWTGLGCLYKIVAIKWWILTNSGKAPWLTST